MFLVDDRDNNGDFKEYDPWNPPQDKPVDWASYEISVNTTSGGFRILDNQIEMYIPWNSIGVDNETLPVFQQDFWLAWATDQENTYLGQAPATDRQEEEADLVLEKTANVTEAHLCDAVMYTYNVSLASTPTGYIMNVTVSDDVVGLLNYTDGYVGGDSNGDGNLTYGEHWIFQREYIINWTDPDPLKNTAIVSALALETDSTNNIDTWSIDILDEWESYANGERTIVCNLFDESSNTVYMMSSDIPPGNYTVEYYDGNGDLVTTVYHSGFEGGKLKCSYYFPSDLSVAPGNWIAKLIDIDRSECFVLIDEFEVMQGAIPEFPMVTATIVVSLVCAAAYIFMRKKYVPTRRVGVVR